jgi:hypothetical protein
MNIRLSYLFPTNVHNSRAAQWLTSNTLLWIIFGIAILLRTAQYLSNRSLWGDEAIIALNLIHRSLRQLLNPYDGWIVNPLPHPLGFLIIEKLAVDALGTTEYVLRLFPFLCGIISLCLFYAVAKRFIRPKAVPIALGLFVISDPLIYYSSEVKQYSSDVTIALLLYLIAIWYLKQKRLFVWHSILLGAIGSLLLWFSYPSLFILGGVGVSLILHWYLGGREWKTIGRLLIAYSLWALSFVVFYYVSLRKMGSDQSLSDFWNSSFMPLPPWSFSDIRWFDRTFFQVFETPVGLALQGIAALTFIVGCYSAYVERKDKLFLLTSPILLALLASGFHRYPFSGRTLLFIVPAVLLLIAEGAQQTVEKTKHDAALIGIVLIGSLFFHPLLSASYHLIRPRGSEEIKPVMSYVSKHLQDGDVLYVHWRALPAFRYYKDNYGFTDRDYIVGINSSTDWRNYTSDLERLRHNKRVWIVFSHWRAAAGRKVNRGQIVDEETFFVYQLDGIGTTLDSFKSSGAAAYLYDLTMPL